MWRALTRSLSNREKERQTYIHIYIQERECNIAVDMLKAWVRTAASTQAHWQRGWMGARVCQQSECVVSIRCRTTPLCIHGVVGAVLSSPKLIHHAEQPPASRSSQSPGDAAREAGDGAQAPAGASTPARQPRSLASEQPILRPRTHYTQHTFLARTAIYFWGCTTIPTSSNLKMRRNPVNGIFIERDSPLTLLLLPFPVWL